MYLTIDGVEKSFSHQEKGQVKVLVHFQLEIETGQFVSIVGPSGCGKSTLLYLVAGLEKADKGEIRIGGKRVTGAGPERVVAFQEAGLLPWLTILDNVKY